MDEGVYGRVAGRNASEACLQQVRRLEGTTAYAADGLGRGQQMQVRWHG
jgi:hypothetical protein